MREGFIRIESKGKIAEIFGRLERAQEEIYKCYTELQALGVVVFGDEAADGEKPPAAESTEPDDGMDEKTRAFLKRVSVLDKPGDKEIRLGPVSLRTLVGMKLANNLNYSDKTLTRIVIEYDDAAGKGWMRVTDSDPD